LSKLFLPDAVITTIINPMPIIDINGMILSIHLTFPFNKAWNSKPAKIGISTTFVVSQAIDQKSTGTSLSASNRINNGVNNGANKVETAVTAIDSARFALARYDITFEASPLGQQPTKIIPAAIL
jgi:hypothetical protein